VIQTFFSIDNPVVTILSDMGTTMVTVAYTIELVPSFRDFDWGAGYFYSLFSLVPSLFWRLNPAAAHAYSDWLIWFHSPYNAARGGGLGYSFIAEAYLNFGWVGGPIALGIMGLLYGRLTLWATRSNDPARLAMVATLLGFGLLFARGETGRHLVRPLAWYALFPYLGVFVLRRLRYELPWHLRRQRITRQE
jgi:oligosaccharide repeat unit polymerase